MVMDRPWPAVAYLNLIHRGAEGDCLASSGATVLDMAYDRLALSSGIFRTNGVREEDLIRLQALADKYKLHLTAVDALTTDRHPLLGLKDVTITDEADDADVMESVEKVKRLAAEVDTWDSAGSQGR